MMSQKTIVLLTFLTSFIHLNAQYAVNNSGAFNLQIESPNIIQVGLDDHIKVPLGFQFEFFDIIYDSVYIDFHGFITFDEDTPFVCCEGQSLPDDSSPNNLIAAAWTDPYPFYNDGNGFFYNEYKYETLPNNGDSIFVVTFEYESNNCDFAYYYGQIKLFKGSNVIEIHTSEYNGTNDCINATQGIENINGNVAFYHADRNSSLWNINNDFISFTPLLNLDLQTIFSISPVCSGNQDVAVYLFNNGLNTIDSFDIAWEWDNFYQDSQRIIATIAPNNYFYQVLGNKTFGNPGEAHNLRAWIFNPNGQLDENMNNDTLESQIYVGLRDTFTIGGTTPDYTTINEAISDLEAYGACDTVIFNIRPGTYNEQLDLQYFSSPYTVFQAENGDSSSVVIQQNNTNVIKLSNVFNVVFKKLTIRQTGFQSNHVFQLNQYCININIEQCHIEAAVNGYGSVIYILEHAGIINIKGNTIKNGYNGIYMTEYYSNLRDNIVIENNSIIGFDEIGIDARQTIGMKILGNYISNNTSGNYGINSEFNQNEIIANNTLNLHGVGYGIYIRSSLGTARIFNNMISMNVTNSNSIGILAYNYEGNSFFKVANNSVNLSSQYEITGSSCFTALNGNCDSLVNNVFVNHKGKAYVLINNQNLLVDYNVLFTSGPILAQVGFNNYDSIPALNAIGKEAHGKNFSPTFFSNTNLHTKDVRLNNLGLAHPQVLTDLDGQIRSVTSPDQGADEFTPPARDLATLDILPHMKFKYGSQAVKTVVHNLGTDTIENVTIKWSVNNVDQPDFIFNGSIASTDKDTITIGNYTFNYIVLHM